VYPTGSVGLDGVTLDIRRGERVAVIGPSGAGKSTLLRLFNRLLDPTGGTIRVNGQDVTRAHGPALRALRRRVGMVFQQFNLVPRLTVLENVLIGTLGEPRGVRGMTRMWRRFPPQTRAWALECLATVGIACQAGKLASELSGGQQQRVAIARVLAQRCEVVLADEPVSSLDPASVRQVMEALELLHREHGVTLVMNLHQTDLARRHASRTVALRTGRVVWDLPSDAVGTGELRAVYGDAVDAH
jgi:phosphonate transport system ATP-binding protein